MGKIIKVKSSDLLPSQDFVKEKTINHILNCIVKNKLEELPPIPIVRKSPDSKSYIAIDGHNLIVIFSLLKNDFQVYLAESSNDKLIGFPGTQEAIMTRNSELKEKYDSVIQSLAETRKKGVLSFKDLRSKYDFLASIEVAKKAF